MIGDPPDWQALRGKFPLLSRLAYFDTASVGPISSDAMAAALRYYEWSAANGDLASDKWYAEVDDCRGAIASLIGAAPVEIGFVPNTSTAMSCAALLFEGQGAVLTARGEHPSVVTPWHARHFRVDKAEPDANGLFTPACYERALRPDTRVISISHVRYGDGQANDLAGIGAIARSHGLHLVVDAIQSAGILPIDVGVGIDLLGFAGFKWLNAGHGSGALYVRDGLIERYGLPIAGRRSRSTDALIEITGLDPLYSARAFELGAIPVPNAMALGASLKLIQSVGAQSIAARVSGLVATLRSGLRDLGFETATDGAAETATPIVAVRCEDSEALTHELASRNVHAAARSGFLRLAISWYNDHHDIERCLDGLGEIGGPGALPGKVGTGFPIRKRDKTNR